MTNANTGSIIYTHKKMADSGRPRVSDSKSGAPINFLQRCRLYGLYIYIDTKFCIIRAPLRKLHYKRVTDVGNK